MKAVLVFVAALFACSHLLAEDRFQFLQTIPNGIGVNIHFTDPRPGEMDQLVRAGFKFVRMDFSWVHIEKEDGTYDFSHYDTLMRNLDERGMRAMLILDYAHPKHDENQSPHTEAGRAAFVRFAMAGVTHFKGRGVFWEMYNEPNIKPFWRPKPHAEDYVALARAVGVEMKKRFPDEIFIGPASSKVDMPFVEACCKGGLLEYFDAVTVHPYRPTAPEIVAGDYGKLDRLIAGSEPAGKHTPIFSGEWGYSSAWKDFDVEKQAKYLARQWLMNALHQINLSIWYDWHDDGSDAKEGEHHFGLVYFPYHENREEPYDPKPAYQAAKTFTSQLAGYRFEEKLESESIDDYVLQFVQGRKRKIVAWTISPNAHDICIRMPEGRTVESVSHLGKDLEEMVSGPKGLFVTVSDAPVYLTPVAAAIGRPSPTELPSTRQR